MEDNKDKVHGEGNYAASRQYNEATKKFAQSGQVEAAAKRAAPSNPQEAEQMRQAEAAGKQRAKGEDPELHQSGADDDAVEDGGDVQQGDLPQQRP
jgi:hypothetical protein